MLLDTEKYITILSKLNRHHPIIKPIIAINGQAI